MEGLWWHTYRAVTVHVLVAGEPTTVLIDKQDPPELDWPGPVPAVTFLAGQLSQGLPVWSLDRA